MDLLISSRVTFDGGIIFRYVTLSRGGRGPAPDGDSAAPANDTPPDDDDGDDDETAVDGWSFAQRNFMAAYDNGAFKERESRFNLSNQSMHGIDRRRRTLGGGDFNR